MFDNNSIKEKLLNGSTEAMKTPTLFLELVNDSPNRKSMFFSRPFRPWQHLSDIPDEQIGGHIRSFLRDHPDGQIRIVNSDGLKELIGVFNAL